MHCRALGDAATGNLLAMAWEYWESCIAMLAGDGMQLRHAAILEV